MLKSEIEIFRKFVPIEEVLSIEKYGNGHINDTFLVVTDSGKFILQRVNSKIFNIENLAHNYKQLIDFTSKTNAIGKFFPIFLKDRNNHVHYMNKKGEAWRVSLFIVHTCTYLISPNTNISRLAGITMGKFQNLLNSINPDLFYNTIDDFHNPIRRLIDYNNALSKSNSRLKEEAAEEILIASDNRYIADEASKILVSGKLPMRITHNDPKLENILFKQNYSTAYTIDLDTIMNGAIMFDFGDMVRSITSLATEDECDTSKINFNMEHFNALCQGYFSQLANILTKYEKKSIYSGITCIIYIQGIRFLTDFLEGNPYYKVDYKNHNLIRCRTQFKLLSDILSMKNEVSHSLKSSLG